MERNYFKRVCNIFGIGGIRCYCCRLGKGKKESRIISSKFTRRKLKISLTKEVRSGIIEE